MLGGITNSVSFRQGTNVEFEGPSFVGVAEAAAHKVRTREVEVQWYLVLMLMFSVAEPGRRRLHTGNNLIGRLQ